MEKIFKRAQLSYCIQSTFFKVAESLIAIVTGGFIGVAIQEKAFSWGIFICSLLFLATQILKFVLATSMGSEILRELWCRHELESQKRILHQSLCNFHRIIRSIRCLNQTTCSISDPVCIGPFDDYIQPLIKTFFDNPGEILCTRDSKIHLALHCNIFERNAEGTPNPNSFFSVIQNDFPDLSSDHDFLREYENVRSRAKELNVFTVYQTQYSKQVNCIIGCPIPTVCLDGDTLGCIMIAANVEPSAGCSLQEVMDIYAHILSNSISKYIDCILMYGHQN